jgi:hypothetical protein
MNATLGSMPTDPVSAVASWLTPPIDDRQILELFREWIGAQRAWSAVNDEEEAEQKAAWQAAVAIRDKIALMPAAGPIGISIKVFLHLHLNDDWHRDDAAALSGQGSSLYVDGGLEKAILRDAVRFVPELAPLAANMLKEADADDAEPAVIGFGEPEGQTSRLILLPPLCRESPVARRGSLFR